jgi:membrane-bound lytic murein transglycosylase F
MIKFLKHISYLLIVLIACTPKPKETTRIIIDRDIDKIKAKGTLKALINYSSTSYFIYKGIPMGFEYELLKKYTDHVGIELEVIPIKNMDSVFVDLNTGVADIVAANLTITKQRLTEVNFTLPIIITKQVLVQRKPDNWRKMRRKELANSLLQSPLDLANKTIIVREGSSFYTRLKNLNNEIGGKINIKSVSGEITMEQLIEEVATKKINYTVADKNIALVNQWHYPNIDASLTLSLDQKIAWATRTNADSLTLSINNWLHEFQKTKKFKILYNKYFNNKALFTSRVQHKYYTLGSGQISPYDELIKKHAVKINWDWELLAALIYQESHFNNDAIGWGGSFGLMQMMPQTGARFGVDTTSSPEQNIIAGVKYIKKLNAIWEKSIADTLERIPFILASYNAGPGHVIDAKNLAKKFKKNPLAWEEVSYYLLHKTEPKYYNDDVVKHGYCKGYIVYDYVNEIMERYQHYKTIMKEKEL